MENAPDNSGQDAADEMPAFTGTEVGYYFICHKKLWWFAHGVQMEHEHDRVHLGRLVHEDAYARRKKELDIDGKIVLDWREDGCIHEVKLTDKMEEAHEMQLLYYLYYLKLKGVEGLRVIDASVFPNVISGNINGPAMMVGWKGAEMILRDTNY